MSDKFDVAALGELLIDFTNSGKSAKGNGLFEANPGGAPCNVLAMLAKLGKKTAFIGKVGDDLFGRSLREVIRTAGIDSQGLILDPEAHTTITFVQTAPDGDRDFVFYRNPGADCLLKETELDPDLLRNIRVLHFGSLSLTHPSARAATRAAVKFAKASGATVSFDPNLRVPLWDSLKTAKEQIFWGCEQCDILKVAKEELEFLTGSQDIQSGQQMLQTRFPNIQILFVTDGSKGSWAFYRRLSAFRPAFGQLHTIDTTGAGDTFCGCCLNYLLEHKLNELMEENLTEMLDFANAAAGLVTTKRGAIRSMPSISSIRELLLEGPQC